MAARALTLRQPEYIDLVSDDDFEVVAGPADPRPETPVAFDDDRGAALTPAGPHNYEFLADYMGFGNEDVPSSPPAPIHAQPAAVVHGQYLEIDGEEVFIPDEDEVDILVPAPAVQRNGGAPVTGDAVTGASVQSDHNLAHALQNEQVTVDTCLQRVLAIFPDISHDHVRELYNGFDTNGAYENLPGPARLENILDKLIDTPSYPRQEKGKQAVRKRKREDSIDESSADTKRWEAAGREEVPRFLKVSMAAMLKAEYPDMTQKFIGETLSRETHFYQAYIALAKATDDRTRSGKSPYSRGRPPKTVTTADIVAANSGWPALAEELIAARIRVAVLRAERAAEDVKKKAEEDNLQRAKDRGETAECQACFDELPMNRQIHCDGPTAHFTCFECLTNYIKVEIGESRCRVLCTAGCGAGFAAHQLNLLADKQLLEKLAELEQEKAIRDAGLEDLEECPFCDYKAIMPPIEEDFEFRCANPECEKTSCRRCKSMSHIPISCEEHAKELAKNTKIDARHKIEEAMTAALVRSCNKCKKQFIKDLGCNKMTCPSCGNLQCYVCSGSLTDYNHFDQGPGQIPAGAGQAKTKKCPLYDNVEERHEREVKEAEAAARKQLLEENPDLQDDDMKIKVSAAVQKAEQDRARRAGAGVPGVPVFHPYLHMHGMGGYPLGGLVFDGAVDDEDEDEEADEDEQEDEDGEPIMNLPERRQRLRALAGQARERQRRVEVQLRQLRLMRDQVEQRQARLGAAAGQPPAQGQNAFNQIQFGMEPAAPRAAILERLQRLQGDREQLRDLARAGQPGPAPPARNGLFQNPYAAIDGAVDPLRRPVNNNVDDWAQDVQDLFPELNRPGQAQQAQQAQPPAPGAFGADIPGRRRRFDERDVRAAFEENMRAQHRVDDLRARRFLPAEERARGRAQEAQAAHERHLQHLTLGRQQARVQQEEQAAQERVRQMREGMPQRRAEREQRWQDRATMLAEERRRRTG